MANEEDPLKLLNQCLRNVLDGGNYPAESHRYIQTYFSWVRLQFIARLERRFIDAASYKDSAEEDRIFLEQTFGVDPHVFLPKNIFL